ncbi:MAG: FlgD immunoglobulin-like domain containing protein, partial [bacterium]
AQVVADVDTDSEIYDLDTKFDGVWVTNPKSNTIEYYEFVYTYGASEMAVAALTEGAPIYTAVSLKHVETIQVGTAPKGIFIDPRGQRAVVVNSGSDNVSIINISVPSESIAKSIVDIENLLIDPGTPDKARQYLEQANENLGQALDRLEQGKVKQFFDEIKKAIHELKKAEKHGAVVSDIIDSLIGVARSLAKNALYEARQFVGDKKVDKEIEKAEKELQKAEEELTKGNPDKAMDHFKNAWEHASKAIQKAGGELGKTTEESGSSTQQSLPEEFSLSQNYPNPFNPSTTILFEIPASAKNGVHVEVKVYNILGQLVNTLVDEMKLPGRYTVTWNGRYENGLKAASGLYLFKIKADEFQKVKKMILLQ